MSGSDSAGVNAMVPGRKCEPHSSASLHSQISRAVDRSSNKCSVERSATMSRCIVGILRVRDFSTATEVRVVMCGLLASGNPFSSLFRLMSN